MAKTAAAGGPVEGPWPLPDGWRWERIDAVAPVSLRRGPDNLAEGTEVAFVPMAAVEAETGGIDVSARRPIASVRKGFTRFGSGDVIFAKITPCMENGKIAVIPDLPHGIGFGSTEFHVLAPREVSARYLYHWVSQRGFRETAEFNMTGTAGQKRVPTDFMRNALVPVPPPPKQNVIVARIDELLAEIDDGEAALARARHDLATWRKALLKAAVTGELTADWRAANPSTEIGIDFLARILTDRRAQWEMEPRNARKKYVEPTGIDTNISERAPPGWAVATIEQVAFVENGQTPKGIDGIVMLKGDIPWFKVSSMNAPGNNDRLNNSNWWLSADLAATLGLRVHPAGAIVFPKRGGSIFTEKKRRLGVPGSVDLNVMAVVPVEAASAHAWTFFQNLSLRAISDGSNVPQINYGDVAFLEIALPPIDEALEISARVESALAATSEVEAEIDQFLFDAATLRQSILAAAFRGELA